MKTDMIQNIMFLPLMKKALNGGIGADAKTSLSLARIRYSPSPPPPFKMETVPDQKKPVIHACV